MKKIINLILNRKLKKAIIQEAKKKKLSVDEFVEQLLIEPYKLSPLLRDKFSSVVSKWDNEIITNILESNFGQLADHLLIMNSSKFH